MAGFFRGNKAAIQAPVRTRGCSSCGLAQGVMSPKMPPTGEGRRGVLMIAEGPGREEDEKNTQLIGRVGQKLRRTMGFLGVDLDRDCRKTNAVRCRPPENREPSKEEISQCRQHIFDEIRDNPPRVIVPLGGSATYALLGHRWKHDSNFAISRWRGLTIPDHGLGAWVCPTFHPSYVEREGNHSRAVEIIWKRDLERAFALCDAPLPSPVTPDVKALDGEEAISDHLLYLTRLANVYRNREQQLVLAIDYETTGLKPYAEGHRIVSCSIAEGPGRAAAWVWNDSKNNRDLMRMLLNDPSIGWVAGNMKFEQVWSRAKIGIGMSNWRWDVVTCAHVIDNRRGNSNVKFQAYTRLGVLDYDSHIRQHLRASDSNAFNNIGRIGPEELLKYNGWDACLEYALFLKQREEVA